jgi:hypothetical protein
MIAKDSEKHEQEGYVTVEMKSKKLYPTAE